MNFVKTRNVKSPSRGTKRSAGLDFFIPEWSEEYYDSLISKNGPEFFNANSRKIDPATSIIIPKHTHVLIPSGIIIDLSSSKCFRYNDYNALSFIAHNKSSVGIRQLDVAATVIDEDYRGEIHLSITNVSDKPIKIEYGQKIVQFLLVPIIIEDFLQVSSIEEFDKTERSAGGFGSTGIN